MKDEKTIRHAYENVLTACARLAAFATCQPTFDADNLLNNRQITLAADDLVVFAINARRLMDATSTLAEFTKVSVPIVDLADLEKPSTLELIAITRVVNIIVHHHYLEVSRLESDFVDSRGLSFEELYDKYAATSRRAIKPLVRLRSDRANIGFQLSALIEIFEKQVLIPIVEACSNQSLFLNEEI